MAEENKTYLTEEGLKKLQDEYYNLVHVVREEVKQELAEARAQGDLSENADYDAARDEQAKVEARIATLEYMLRNYELIDTKKAGKKSAVHIGSSVTLIFNDTKEEITYDIVGSTESDPLNGRLSNETPLAQAILDHKVGDVCEVRVANPYSVEILKIK